MSVEPPKSLADFQDRYSHYLRAPQQHALPAGIPARRSGVYETLLFNNVRGFIDRCFPVSRSILDENDWLALCKRFYKEWQCRTPIFSRIPEEFAQHAAQCPEPDSPWLPELLHYEWLELEIDLAQAQVGRVHLLARESDPIEANPTLSVQHYQWPVHKIGPSFIPDEPAPTTLCVYRTYDMAVRFMEVNAVTALLLQIIQQQPQSPLDALAALCEQLPSLKPEQVQEFGRLLITQLIDNNVLLVSHSPLENGVV